MKKLLFLVAFLATSMFASAQFYVGGGIGFDKTDDNGAKTTTYKFAPEVGYTLNDNWAFGLVLEYADFDNDVCQYGIQPYARYTFYRNGAFSAFADGCVAYVKAENGGFDSKGWGIGVEPGIAYSLSDKFSIVAKLGNLGYTDVEEKKSFGFEFDNELTFGLYYSF